MYFLPDHLTSPHLFKREKLHLNYFTWLMTVIYNIIDTSVLSIPLEKAYGLIAYSNVSSIDYKIKSSMYLLILFKLTCLYTYKCLLIVGSPGGSDGKDSPAMQNPWVRKIPWRRKWQPTPVILPGEFHGQRSQAGYSPWGCKESGMTEQLSLCLTTILWVLECSLFCLCAKLLQSCPVWLFATLRTVTLQVSLSMEFSRQEYWSGLPCPPPRAPPDAGLKPASPVAPVFQVDSLPLSYGGSPLSFWPVTKINI